MKKLIALVCGILSFCCLIGCLYLVNWIWTVKKPLIEKTTFAFARLENVLNMASRSLEDLKSNLTVSRSQFGGIIVHTTSVDPKQKQPNFVQAFAARSLLRELSPSINEAQLSIEKVMEASIVVSSILESIQDVQGFEQLDMTQVRTLQSQINGVTKASVELGDLLETRTPGQESETAEQKSRRIASRLDEILQLIEAVQKSVGNLQNRIEDYKTQSLYWMNNGPTIATVILCWVAISQVLVIYLVASSLRANASV